jgi:hypothetical protein
VLYSNPGHVIFQAYKIGGMWRLNSTFTEASEMAGSLIGGLGILSWQLATQPFRTSRMLYALLLLVMMLMTLSTTGYLCLALLIVAGGGLYLGHLLLQARIGAIKVVLALAVFFGGTILFTVSEPARMTVAKVVTSVVLDKQQTESYRARTQSHSDALDALKATYYIGAGWGSMRASGMVYTLLAAVGIPGLVFFLGGYAALFLPLLRATRNAPPGARDDMLQRSLIAMSLLLCSMVIAGTEPMVPTLWFLFGTAIVAASQWQTMPSVRLRAATDARPEWQARSLARLHTGEQRPAPAAHERWITERPMTLLGRTSPSGANSRETKRPG